MIDLGYNNLVIEAYSGATLIQDPGGLMARAENVQFYKGYPGGGLNASFYIERNVLDWWLLDGADRLVFRNGQKAIYEGWIANKQDLIASDAQGTLIRLTGGLGHALMPWMLNKPWADTSIDDQTWIWQATPAEAYEEFEHSRENDTLHVYPSYSTFADGEYGAFRYSAPTGQTIKRITYDYEFDENSGSWEISTWRSTDASSWTQMTGASGETYTTGTTTVITASGSGSIDVTLGTPSRYVELRFYARAINNPSRADHNHGEWSNVTVYTETSSINMYEIALDLVGLDTLLNSSTAYVEAAGTPLSLVPYVTPGFASVAEILEDVVGRGDGAYNRWAFGCHISEKAASPDGKPVLYLEQVPALTDYEYAVRLDENNVLAPISISKDIDSVRNWIVLTYTDKSGLTAFRSPDDSASLKDDTSITDYGRKAMVSYLGDSTTTIADAFGQRLLAQYKDPQYRLISPVTVQGYVRHKSGQIIPACEIEPGNRICIENVNLANAAALIFLVTGVAYDDESETCAITTGRLDEAILPRHRHIPVMGGPARLPESASGGETGGTPSTGGGSGGGMQRHIWELIGWSRRQFLDAKANGTWKKVKAAAIKAKLKTGSYKNYRRFL